MSSQFSPVVNEAVDLIWKSFSAEAAHRGYRLLEQAFEDGDADAGALMARCSLGELYVWDGAGFDEDFDKAKNLLALAVERGSALAVLISLRCGVFDEEMSRKMPFASTAQAYNKVLEAAGAGCGMAAYQVASALFWGDYLVFYPDSVARFASEEDYYRFAYPLARTYLERSFETGLGLGFGQYNTIYESEQGDITKETFEKNFEALAQTGNPMICNDFGTYLMREYDDSEQAFAFFLLAVEQGDLPSASNVAYCYYHGRGVEQDFVQAEHYYRLAAEAGDAKSQFALGDMYLDGLVGDEQNFDEAFKWLRRAYDNVNKDEKLTWKVAAELSILYQNGLGTMADDNQAFRLLQVVDVDTRLANDEIWSPLDSLLCTALGVAYAYGRGTDRNLSEAVRYLDKAIELGSEDAPGHRARIKKTIFGGWRLS